MAEDDSLNEDVVASCPRSSRSSARTWPMKAAVENSAEATTGDTRMMVVNATRSNVRPNTRVSTNQADERTNEDRLEGAVNGCATYMK